MIINNIPNKGGSGGNSLYYSNLVLKAANFVTFTAENAEEQKLIDDGYIYRASLFVEGIQENMTPEVVLSTSDIADANADISNLCRCYNGGVYSYSKKVPTKDIAVLTLEVSWNDIDTGVINMITPETIGAAINTALAQAKASGEFDGKEGVDGKDGQDGYTPQKNVDYFDGKDGQDGSDGKDGVSPTVSVSAITGGHRITIADKNGTKTVDVMDGSDGEDGSNGKNGNGIKSAVLNADYTLTLTFDDGTSYTTPSIRGATGSAGKDGSNGADGISPIVSVSKSGKVTTITITDKNGTKTATVNDGADGSPGSPGKDGTSVTVKSVSESTADGGSNVVTFSDGKTLTVKNGSKGSGGTNGTNGVSVSSVKQTTTSSADGGSNVVTVTLSNGTTSTFTVKNGSKGNKGDTGSDYVMTEADMDKVVAEVQASANQQHPLFANKVADCTDTTKVYVLPDGYIYGYILKESAPPEITIENGSNGYWGFDSNNSKFKWTSSNGWYAKLSNKISVTPGDQLSYKGKMQYTGNKSYAWYGSDGKAIETGTLNSESSATIVTAPAGAVSVQFASFAQTKLENVILEIKWVLCQAAAPKYQWASTGHAFVPADYESRILALESSNGGTGSSLKGKTIVYDGDSICESRTGSSANNGGGYAKLIADKTGSTYVNQAVGGARLTTKGSNSYHSVVDNLPNLPKNADLYCFEGGINDYWTPKALGTFSKTDFTGTLDTNTICGALETIFRYALSNFVGKPICFVIVHKIQSTAYSKNSNGDAFEDYRNAMVGICNKYSIPYYDAFSESGLNGWNTAQNNAYLTSNTSGTADGIHPNAEGYKRYYVPQLIQLFERIMPI